MVKKDFQPVCLITGGSSGIGLRTALLFARQGYRLAICGRSEPKLSAAKAQIEAASDLPAAAGCLAITADLGQNSQAIRVADETLAAFGRIDVLVNNAAAAPLAAFEKIGPDKFESAINVNIRSVFYLTQSVWRLMMRQGRGVVVNISSLAAIDPFPGFGLYGACKAWLELMTQALAAEGKPAGLRLYTIRPGAVETPLLRSLFPDYPADQAVNPDEVANRIWEVSRDNQQYESGATIEVTRQNPSTARS